MPKLLNLFKYYIKAVKGDALWTFTITVLSPTILTAIWGYLIVLPVIFYVILIAICTNIFWVIILIKGSPTLTNLKKKIAERKTTSHISIIPEGSVFKGSVSKDKNLLNDLGTRHEDKLTVSGVDHLIPGFLDIDCVLSHEADREVKRIRDKRNKIIPTKYLFAHADSYHFYNELRKDRSYTIRRAEHFFGAVSDELAAYLAGIVKGNRRLHVVSLGIGLARKESALIQALGEERINASMLAIDINPSFIYESLQYLRDDIKAQSIDFKIIIGDFDRITNYELSVPNNTPILFLALGGVFGNQNERNLIDNLRNCYKGEKYLLIDFQTKEPFMEKDKGGYNSNANKRFIKHIIEKFCGDAEIDLKEIEAVDYKKLTELHANNAPPSSVDGSETIVMVGRTKSGQKRYVGYSTRYDEELLKEFFQNNNCELQKMFSHPDTPHTSLLLYKL